MREITGRWLWLGMVTAGITWVCATAAWGQGGSTCSL
jgi:hypothetical protein